MLATIGTVVAVGRYRKRWFYVERLYGRCLVGRYWLEAHPTWRCEQGGRWAKQHAYVAASTISEIEPKEPRPAPPTACHSPLTHAELDATA
jgi:hypothetical protein